MELKDKSLQAILTRITTHEASRDFMANEIVELARILDDDIDARRAMGRLAEQRDNRLNGEIAERSQRQLEITGRLASVEEWIRSAPPVTAIGTYADRLAEAERGLKALARRVDGLDGGPGIRQADAERLDREQADAATEAIEAIEYARVHAVACDVRHSYLPSSHKEAETWLPHAWVVDAIMALQHDLANARADVQVHQSARQALETWEAEVRTALGVGPGESRKWMVAEIARQKADVENYRKRWNNQADAIIKARARANDLEAQVAALQKAIDDVWALVEQPDGYGSPYWTEPGLDDTTPAQAVAAVLAHLRAQLAKSNAGRGTLASALDRATARIGEWRREAQRVNGVTAEAMAALNAADRQSDDDQICGC